MPPKKKTYTRKVIQNPEALHPNMILKVADMKNANDEIIAELVKFFGISETQVKEITNFMGY